MKTLAAVRSYVRTYLDVTAEDIPDVLIDEWTLTAFTNILHSRRRFPHFEAAIEVPTVIGTSSYTNPMGVAGRISAVVISSKALRQVELSKAMSQPATEGTPTTYARYGVNVLLFPTPTEIKTVTFFGQRQPLYTWLTNLALPIDLPDGHQSALQAWVMCEAFKHQQDIPMANNAAVDFETMLTQANGRMIDTPDTFIGSSQ